MLFMWFGQQNVISDYELPSGSYGHENDEEPNNSDTVGKIYYSKVAGSDYEAIQNPDDYAAAVRVYANTVKDSTSYDDTIISEYSELEDIDNTTANDEEEIYSDPGHSESDIYACFERKKFRMIKRNDIR